MFFLVLWRLPGKFGAEKLWRCVVIQEETIRWLAIGTRVLKICTVFIMESMAGDTEPIAEHGSAIWILNTRVPTDAPRRALSSGPIVGLYINP